MYWWENEFIKVRDNRLCLGDREATAIAEEHGTPLFVYSPAQIRHNYHQLQTSFGSHTSCEVRLCYAMKANSHPEILELLSREGAWIDAVSPGEVNHALNHGFSPERILFTGTSLSQEDIRRTLGREGLIINIDAEEQLELMQEIREEEGWEGVNKVSVRWNPGIGRGFSPKTVTAGQKSPDGTPVKFGIEDSRVIPVFNKAVEMGFKPVGLHQHLGSGWVKEDFYAVQRAVEAMIAKATEIQGHGHKPEFLDFGGGFGPQYAEREIPFPVDQYARFIGEALSKSGLDIDALAIEPGKYLVGNAGVLLLRVEYTKTSYGNRFACVNSGTFNSVPRPAIYTQAQHPIIHCTRVRTDQTDKVTVAGNLCETGDVFGREIQISPPQRGDFLALLCAGAYCRSMASSFNLRPIPPELFL